MYNTCKYDRSCRRNRNIDASSSNNNKHRVVPLCLSLGDRNTVAFGPDCVHEAKLRLPLSAYSIISTSCTDRTSLTRMDLSQLTVVASTPFRYICCPISFAVTTTATCSLDSHMGVKETYVRAWINVRRHIRVAVLLMLLLLRISIAISHNAGGHLYLLASLSLCLSRLCRWSKLWICRHIRIVDCFCVGIATKEWAKLNEVLFNTNLDALSLDFDPSSFKFGDPNMAELPTESYSVDRGFYVHVLMRPLSVRRRKYGLSSSWLHIIAQTWSHDS